MLNRSELVSQSVRERVSDKGKQWLDSGPINKSWTHLIKKSKWYVWQLVDIGQGSFIFKKSYKIYKRKTNTSLNLTQLHIHIHNTNLKMNLYETPFLYSILAIRKTERLWTIFFLDLIIPANTPTTKWVIRNLKMFYIGD